MHGDIKDSARGWRNYQAHLEWLMADEGRQKAAAFDRMSKGWALGSDGYQRALLKDFRKMERARDWGGGELADLNRLHWRDLLESGSKALGESLAQAKEASKSAPWKIALAAWIKRESSVSNGWLSEQLHMGPPDAVSRYVGELTRGERVEARQIFDRLTTKVRG